LLFSIRALFSLAKRTSPWYQTGSDFEFIVFGAFPNLGFSVVLWVLVFSYLVFLVVIVNELRISSIYWKGYGCCIPGKRVGTGGDLSEASSPALIRWIVTYLLAILSWTLVMKFPAFLLFASSIYDIVYLISYILSFNKRITFDAHSWFSEFDSFSLYSKSWMHYFSWVIFVYIVLIFLFESWFGWGVRVGGRGELGIIS